MHDDNLKNLCAATFAQQVDEMFETREVQALLRGKFEAKAPYIDYPYFVLDEALIKTLKRRVCNALAAREWHRKHAPAWAQPLPLSYAELDRLADGIPRQQLLRDFAVSLSYMEYDYKRHPSFLVYVCGVMAYAHAPPEIRDDPFLRANFADRPLAGLDRHLYWRTPEKIEEDRRHIAGLPARWRANGINPDIGEWRDFLDELNAHFASISR